MKTSICREMSSRFVRGLDDDLNPAEAAELMAHLDHCPDCRSALEQAAASPDDWDELARWRQELKTPPLGDQPDDEDLFEETAEFPHSAHDFSVHYLAPSSAPDSIGMLDDIEVLDIVGRGGMGVVVKGRQVSLNRLVAVKLLRPDLAGRAVARQRFAREAQATAAVMYPNVMPIHSVRTSGRLPYLVMPFLDCESLDRRLEREGPLGLTDILAIGHQVARALEAAHAQGLVHRDVKPGNILLERAGPRVWLADFGLARALDDASLTNTGVIAGTPLFMSPEQARGELIDARSDLFSLGSVLYMMCVGQPPFRAETTYGVLRRIVESRPRSIRDREPAIPEWLEHFIEQLHEKDPDQRLGSSAEAAQLLEGALRAVQQPTVHHLPDSLLFPPTGSNSRRLTSSASSPPLSFRQLAFAFFVGGSLMMLALLAMLPLLPWSAPLAAVPDEPVIADVDPSPFVDELAPLLLAQAEGDPAPRVESKYASAQEALAVASGYLSLKEYAKSREPLEEALKLTADDQDRIRIYRALIPAYTIASDWKPKVEALEFIIRHSKQDAERSLARTEMMGFIRQRGKTKELVKRYEQQLKDDPSDEPTLFILNEVYSRLTDEPQKAASILERMTKLKAVAGEELSVPDAAQLAAQYVKSRKYKEGAELFEKTASRDKSLAAWHYKEAANAWLKAENKDRALAAAKASAECTPEQRSQLLEYFWHRSLADVFMDTNEPALAIPHFEQALAKTTIDGYVKETEQRLARARELAQ